MSDWRTLGDLAYELWHDVIVSAGGPAELARIEAWRAARPHSRLALAILGEESSYGTNFNRNSPINRNAFNLRPRQRPDGSREPGYMAFDSWIAGIVEWRDRLLDPTYAYMPARTLDDLIAIYAPPWDNNRTSAYLASVQIKLARWSLAKDEPMPPFILVTAGHRGTTDFGNPEEERLTPVIARAYRDAFRAAGYTVEWLQETDGDSDPDDVIGGLDRIGQLTRDRLARQPGDSILLDLHYESGGGAGGVFAIVPDERGLSTAVPGGAPGHDTWDNNPLDIRVAKELSARIAQATGLRLRASTLPGVMSETRTGVATAYGARLAMFAYTVGSRHKAVRLVVEHGALDNQQDREIIYSKGFAQKAAAAAVDAIGAIYEVPDEPVPPVEYAAARPIRRERDILVSGRLYLYAPGERSAIRTVTPRVSATDGGAASGPEITPGERVMMTHVCLSDDRLWFIAKNGARLPADAFVS